MLQRLLLVFLINLATAAVHAESCDTDCHEQCRVKTDIPPVEFIEPICHAKCETAKQVACRTGANIPTIPLTPLEQAEVFGNQGCAAPFQHITGVVIARCSNWDGRTDDQHLILQAANVLQSAGIIQANELEGIQVRWCPLLGAEGMAPDHNRIYLDLSLKGNLFATASTLAHEVVHLRQYRRSGSDRFKCEYSRQYVECGGCQDRRNSFEREAIDYQAQIRPQLSQATQQVQVPPPIRHHGFPSGYAMGRCGCWGPTMPSIAPEPRCASGAVRPSTCTGFCQGGGYPYWYVCQ